MSVSLLGAGNALAQATHAHRKAQARFAELVRCRNTLEWACAGGACEPLAPNDGAVVRVDTLGRGLTKVTVAAGQGSGAVMLSRICWRRPP